MTNLAPNDTADSAFVPALSNPFLSGNPLESGQSVVGSPASVTQMMPVMPELSEVGSALGDRRSQAQGSELAASSFAGFSGDSQAVLQALANELAPIYPQVAKALIAPTLDSALQSGVGLFSRGSQLIEGTMDSGKGAVIDRAGDVGSSVRELLQSALSQWQSENNAVRTGLNQQTQALVSDLTSIAAEVDDSAWMDTVKRRLAKARARVETATDGMFSSLGYVGDEALGKDEAAIAQATQRLEQTLVDFRDRADFATTLETAFGDNGPTPEAEALVDDLIAGANGPAVEIVDAQLLLGDGAFGNNTIFISDEVVAEAAEHAEALDDVLLEEVGHYFDQALNTVDSAGDEGEIFARLVQGEDISAAEMRTLKSENDHSTLTLNGTTISVENRRFLGGSANHTFTAPPKPVLKPVMTPVTPVDKLIQPTPVMGSDRKLYLKAGTVDRFDEAMAKQRQRSVPTPVAQPVQPVQPASGNGTVEVQAGDTLSAIAAQHGVQWTDLRKPDGTAFTEAEARVLQIGADVVLPNQPVSAPAPTPTPAPVTVTPPPVIAPPRPAAIRQEAKQLQDDAAVLATASPYAAQAMQEEAQALIEAEEERVAEAARVAAAAKQQEAKERREKIAQLTADADLLATASPYAAQSMMAEAQVLIAETPSPDPQQLKKDAELLATASPYAAQAMNEQAEALIAEVEKEKTQQLFDDAELLATASPYASQVIQAEAVERAAEAQAAEEKANGNNLSKIEQLQKDAELLATASPYASQVMQAEAEAFIAEEKRQTIKRLQSDAALLATASPYAAQAMQAEAKELIEEALEVGEVFEPELEVPTNTVEVDPRVAEEDAERKAAALPLPTTVEYFKIVGEVGLGIPSVDVFVQQGGSLRVETMSDGTRYVSTGIFTGAGVSAGDGAGGVIDLGDTEVGALGKAEIKGLVFTENGARYELPADMTVEEFVTRNIVGSLDPLDYVPDIPSVTLNVPDWLPLVPDEISTPEVDPSLIPDPPDRIGTAFTVGASAEAKVDGTMGLVGATFLGPLENMFGQSGGVEGSATTAVTIHDYENQNLQGYEFSVSGEMSGAITFMDLAKDQDGNSVLGLDFDENARFDISIEAVANPDRDHAIETVRMTVGTGTSDSYSMQGLTWDLNNVATRQAWEDFRAGTGSFLNVITQTVGHNEANYSYEATDYGFEIDVTVLQAELEFERIALSEIA